MSVTAVPQPLKWHGGKSYLAHQIVDLMPPHLHYVEPFAGGLSVLLAKDPQGISEVVGDTNGWLTNFWRIIGSPADFPSFVRFIEATPFSESVFLAAREIVHANKLPDKFDPVLAAVWFFVTCRQSLAGRMQSFAPLSKTRVRRGMNEQVSAWLTAVEGLPQVHSRLARVVTRTVPAPKLIQSEDGEQTLFYLDPPYKHETRTTTGEYGVHEMTDQQHADLLDLSCRVKGKVLISGYDNDLYNGWLHDWTRHEFVLPNNAAGGKEKRSMTEVLWCNF